MLLIVHAAATLFMCGLIWFVHIVHYPLFDEVARDGFARFARRHSRRTSWVVGAPMLAEAATAVWIVLRPPAGIPFPWAAAGVALVLVVWVSTAFQVVPQHRRLGAGFDAAAHRRLVAVNGVRTAAWSARAVLALAMLSAAR